MKKLISLSIRYIPRKYIQLFGHFAARVLSVPYLGKGVICPVCQGEFRKFLPYGRGQARENALCPKCLALERHRLLWLFLKNKTSLFSDYHRMLHIAPEYCFISRLEQIEALEYITADIESPLAKVKMDVHQIPFDENSFDCVLCNHVLEHVDDDRAAMKEIYRVLRPGGWAILQVPFFEPVPNQTYEDPSITSAKDRIKQYGQEDHQRLYGNDYKDRLQSCGFQVTEDRYFDTLGPESIKKHALVDETIFYCTKPAL